MQTPANFFWKTALVNDLGRLTQGVGTRMPEGTNTIKFICRQGIPTKKWSPTHNWSQVYGLTQKNVSCVCVTIGGDKLIYT